MDFTQSQSLPCVKFHESVPFSHFLDSSCILAHRSQDGICTGIKPTSIYLWFTGANQPLSQQLHSLVQELLLNLWKDCARQVFNDMELVSDGMCGWCSLLNSLNEASSPIASDGIDFLVLFQDICHNRRISRVDLY